MIIYKKKFGTTKTELDVFDEIDKIFSEYSQASNIDYKVITIAGQLIRPLEDLEKLLIHYDARTRATILTNAFSSSLGSYNPVKSVREIYMLYRGIIGINKLASYFSSMIDGSQQNAIGYVCNTIKTSNLYRRINN